MTLISIRFGRICVLFFLVRCCSTTTSFELGFYRRATTVTRYNNFDHHMQHPRLQSPSERLSHVSCSTITQQRLARTTTTQSTILFPSNYGRRFIPSSFLMMATSLINVQQACAMTLTTSSSLITFDGTIVLTALKVSLLLFTIPLLIALFQGATAMLNYRNNYGDAPPPKVPAHGLVIAKSNLSESKKSKSKTPNDDNDQTVFHFPWFDNTNSQQRDDMNQPHLLLDNKDKIRLLVIGDSLAVGIGQAQSCTPVLPESIAKELSKGMNGIPVYWTCIGESGASTSWLVRMLKNSTELPDDTTDKVEEIYQPPDFMNWNGKSRKFHGNYYTNGSESYSAHGLWTESSTNQQQLDTVSMWKKRLSNFRNNFDPAAMGPYDIVVLMTGPNDLKTMLLPFMLDDDEKAYQRQMNNKNPQSVVDNLVSLMQTINDKIDIRLQTTMSNVNEQIDTMINSIIQRFDDITDAIQNMQFNETIYETAQRILFGTNIDERNVQDGIVQDNMAANRTDGTSNVIAILLSNMSLSEKIDQSLITPINALKDRTYAIKNNFVESASTKIEAFQSIIEELQRLLDISSDYSQILLHDEFKSLGASYKNGTIFESPILLNGRQTNNDVGVIEKLNTVDDILQSGKPLFVLPAMPARALPIFRKKPLSWFAIPVFDAMKRNLQTLTEMDSDIVLVQEPSLESIIEYEDNIGRIRELMSDEILCLTLRDIRHVDCVSIETSMKNYFGTKQQIASVADKDFVKGTRIFSPDSIHPNDAGYEFWGRHIGNALVQQLPQQKLRANGKQQNIKDKKKNPLLAVR